MAIGPVQLIVLGFKSPDFHGEIIAELERLRESDTVRVIDALAVHKDGDGEVEIAHLSTLTKDEAIEVECPRDALEELPNHSEAALVLIEHRWSLRLHDVIASVGGFRISDGFIISPLDVARMGRASAERSAAVQATP